MPQSNGSTLRQHVPSPTLLSSAAATPTDSDPSADELLRRVRNPRSNAGTCPDCGAVTGNGQHVCQPKAAPTDLDATRIRMETETAWLLRDRQPIDEYRQWAQGAAA